MRETVGALFSQMTSWLLPPVQHHVERLVSICLRLDCVDLILVINPAKFQETADRKSVV